jgi:hypothetical protein
MRRLPRAGFASVCAAFAVVGTACAGTDDGGERAPVTSADDAGDVSVGPETTPPGAELLAQEAPPAVGRPVTGSELGPRMIEGETPGRWPFYWTRAVYSGGGGYFGRRRGAWATDYPKGDRQFLIVLKRLVRLNAYDWENAVHLADPDLRRFPVIYGVEVGNMNLTDEEVEGLRSYLEAGGFMIVDDFWGSREWAIFEWNMRRVFPDRPIVDLDLSHPLFSTFYDIEEIKQVPNIRNARWGVRTHERDGYTPYVRGIADDDGRLMVVINWNTDLGDAWEWAEDPGYPLEYSTFAYELGANMIVYGLTR